MSRSAFERATSRAANDPIRREIFHGLLQTPKSLPCKLFYDRLGSQLFERICELEEYYPTRTELGILKQYAPEVAELLGPHCTVVEFGSGASVKTRLLLDALDRPTTYIPIDISRSALLSSARALAADYPTLRVLPVCADFTTDLAISMPAGDAPILAFFPGSTIGNFDRPQAIEFLSRVRALCGAGGQLLIGVDLKKDRATLEAAYDDRAGVTAEFNRNILRVLNREYGARFPLDAFAHRAIWNSDAGRIEMHLVSRQQQNVELDFEYVHFEAGEHIVTEHCYKYSVEEFRSLAQTSGFEVTRVWTDAAELFSVQLLGAAG